MSEKNKISKGAPSFWSRAFLWLMAAISWSIPVMAALGKAATYSFGTFVFGCIIFTGGISATAAFISLPHLLVAGAFGLSVFFVSLAMEGAWLQQRIYRYGEAATQQPSNNALNDAAKQKFNSAVKKLARDYQKKDFTHKINVKLSNIGWPSWVLLKTFSALLRLVQITLWLMAGAAKGMSAFAGTIGVLHFFVEATHIFPAIVVGFNPITFSVGLIACAICFVCWGKEGSRLFDIMDDFQEWVVASCLGLSADDYTEQATKELSLINNLNNKQNNHPKPPKMATRALKTPLNSYINPEREGLQYLHQHGHFSNGTSSDTDSKSQKTNNTKIQQTHF